MIVRFSKTQSAITIPVELFACRLVPARTKLLRTSAFWPQLASARLADDAYIGSRKDAGEIDSDSVNQVQSSRKRLCPAEWGSEPKTNVIETAPRPIRECVP